MAKDDFVSILYKVFNGMENIKQILENSLRKWGLFPSYLNPNKNFERMHSQTEALLVVEDQNIYDSMDFLIFFKILLQIK